MTPIPGNSCTDRRVFLVPCWPGGASRDRDCRLAQFSGESYGSIDRALDIFCRFSVSHCSLDIYFCGQFLDRISVAEKLASRISYLFEDNIKINSDLFK
jgi:hypothetical protein